MLTHPCDDLAEVQTSADMMGKDLRVMVQHDGPIIDLQTHGELWNLPTAPAALPDALFLIQEITRSTVRAVVQEISQSGEGLHPLPLTNSSIRVMQALRKRSNKERLEKAGVDLPISNRRIMEAWYRTVAVVLWIEDEDWLSTIELPLRSLVEDIDAQLLLSFQRMMPKEEIEEQDSQGMNIGIGLAQALAANQLGRSKEDEENITWGLIDPYIVGVTDQHITRHRVQDRTSQVDILIAGSHIVELSEAL